MNKLITTFCTIITLTILSGAPINYTGSIFPTPQIASAYNGELSFNPRRCAVELPRKHHHADALAKQLIQENLQKIPAYPKGLPLTIRLLHIPGPADSQRYRLTVRQEDGQFIATCSSSGHRGRFYAAMSLLQLWHVNHQVPCLPSADLEDYPDWSMRCLGAYQPCSYAQMILAAMLKVNGIGLVSRDEWRQWGNAPDYRSRLEDIRKFSQFELIDFMLLLHPYAIRNRRIKPMLNIANRHDVHDFTEKCLLAASYGFSTINLTFDDWTHLKNGEYACNYPEEKRTFGSMGKAQAWLANQIRTTVLKRYPKMRIITTPAPYAYSLRSQAAENYFRDFTAELHPSIAIMWTGPEIVSPKITPQDYRNFRQLVPQHQLILWDNSSCLNPPLPFWSTELYQNFSRDSRGFIYIHGQLFFRDWPTLFALNTQDYLWNRNNYKPLHNYKKLFEKLYDCNAEPTMAFISKALRFYQCKTDKEKVTLLGEMIELQKQLAAQNLDSLYPQSWLNKYKSQYFSKLPSLSIRQKAGQPTLDGDCSEAFWQEATEFNLLTRTGETPSTTLATTGKLAFTREALYLAIDCKRPHGKTSPPMKALNEEEVYNNSDLIEIFFHPQNSRNYVHLALDFDGNKYEQVSTQPASAWSPAWQVAIRRRPDGWTAEIAIPFNELDVIVTEPVTNATQWRGNICRQIVTERERFLQCWSPVHANRFHETKLFGHISFIE